MPVHYTSAEAFREFDPVQLTERRARVYQVIHDWPHVPGPTIRDIARSLGWTDNCVSGRVTELIEAGAVDKGEKVRNRETGKPARALYAIAWQEPDPTTEPQLTLAL